MSQRVRRGACVVALFATAITTVNLLGAGSAAAGSINVGFSVINSGSTGLANVDAWYGDCGGNAPAPYQASGYDGSFFWDANGTLTTNSPTWTLPPTQVPNPGLGCGSKTLSLVRLELYPGGAFSYDPWVGNFGGSHSQRELAKDGPNFANFGAVPLPAVGVDGGFRIEGDIVSSTAVPNDRVTVELFQIGCIPPDVCVQPKVTSTGASVGAFTASKNKGNRWTGSVGWPGHYLAFVTDTATGRKVHGYMELAQGQVQTIDLDASCFGMLTCVYMSGAPGAAVGGFHALAPTRILDTRTNVGITGVMMPGDGRSTSGNGYTRRATMLNHELKVTGVGGIPAAGVSAVLLNVTAIASSSPGFLTAFPRPPAVGDIFADQATFGPIPPTSNLNFATGEITPNLVLVKVGAGGTIRFNYSGYAGMHVIADVAGWFDSGASTTAPGGLRFTGIAPVRLMDTRNGIGDTIGRFRPGDSRALLVTNTKGIPASAKSVVVNITAAYVPNGGYVTAYPDGEALPNASNLNISPGGTRSNLAVVKVGTNGKIRLAGFESDMDLIVDIFGYYSSSGGLTTIIDPNRVFDTRIGLHTTLAPFGPGETRNVQIGGLAGVPPNATAVIVNVTVVSPSSWGWLSVWPAGQTRPTVSNLVWFPGLTVPNMTIVGVGAGGQISIYNELGNASVIVDVFGYVV